MPVDPPGGLPQRVELLGCSWQRKDEFHVTLLDPPWLAERLGRDAGEVQEACEAALREADLGPVRYGDEHRVACRDQERTILVMVELPGLEALCADAERRLGADLPRPPAHVTLYTRPGGEGIGLHDEAELDALSAPLREPLTR